MGRVCDCGLVMGGYVTVGWLWAMYVIFGLFWAEYVIVDMGNVCDCWIVLGGVCLGRHRQTTHRQTPFSFLAKSPLAAATISRRDIGYITSPG